MLTASARRDQFVALRAEARRDLKLMLAPTAGLGTLLAGVVHWRGFEALWPVWGTVGAAVVSMIGIGIWAGFFRGRRAIRALRDSAA
ncbi:MAG: hypothetical protein ACJ762_07090 [Solirubrobacteraceae bacterium]